MPPRAPTAALPDTRTAVTSIQEANETTEQPSVVMGARAMELLPDDTNRLASLGLGPDDLQFLADRFLGNVFDFVSQSLPSAKRWTVRHRPLTPSDIISHLEGHIVISTGARWDRRIRRHLTDFVVIDLDAEEDIYTRYDATLAALGQPSLVFRSSDSLGLHLYYLLDQAMDLYTLRSDTGDAGVVLSILNGAGIPEEPGRVEVYPRGSTERFGIQNRIRVPFGAGSRLLEPESLTPFIAGGGAADLRLVRRMIEDGKVEPVDPSVWVDAAGGTPFFKARQQAARGTVSRGQPLDRKEAVTRLWTTGLERSGQRNEAVLALALDLRRRAFSEEKAREVLHRWLDEKNNGWSRTYRRNPRQAHRDVDATIQWAYARPAAREWPPRPGLSEYECRLIFAATSDGSSLVDPSTGECLPRFKVETLAFNRVDAAKQWLLSAGAREREVLLYDPNSPPEHSSAFRSLLLANMSDCWPDPAVNEFVVDIPYRSRVRQGDGISESRQAALWRCVQAIGLFVLERVALPFVGRSEAYRVRLDFGAFSESPVMYGSLLESLPAFFTDAEIRTRYSRHYALRCQRATRTFPDRQAGHAVGEFLRREILSAQAGEAA